MNTNKVLKILGKSLTIMGLVGGYSLARTRRRCSKCGSWSSHIEEIDVILSRKMIGGIFLEDIPAIRKIRVCENGHPIRIIRDKIK